MRLYVACLASYNNGVLHGRWIAASSDVSEMSAAINEVLKTSRFPNVKRQTFNCADCGESRIVTLSDYAENKTPVCEHCGQDMKPDGDSYPSAEEWAIHDYEGLPSSFGEYPSLDDIAAFVEFLENEVEDSGLEPNEFIAIYQSESYSLEEWRDKLRDSFVGIYDSFREYADEQADEMLRCHGIKGDNPLARYFDYESFARDFKFDMDVIDLPDHRVAIFHQS